MLMVKWIFLKLYVNLLFFNYFEVVFLMIWWLLGLIKFVFYKWEKDLCVIEDSFFLILWNLNVLKE